MMFWFDTLSAGEQTAVLSTLAPDEAFIYRDVSQGMLSLARCGGCTVQGHRFTYRAESDELVRADVLALVASMRKAVDKARRVHDKAAAETAQGVLL
jgi:hypothetical protein